MFEFTRWDGSESHRLCCMAELLRQAKLLGQAKLLNCSCASVFLSVQWEFHRLIHRSKDYRTEWI